MQTRRMEEGDKDQEGKGKKERVQERQRGRKGIE